jgi:oxygen-independent coproporphyrinogen-3 oxidase
VAPGLYVHLPFCPYICPYCDFAKWPLRASVAARYLTALRAEMEAHPREPVETIFFGGGTPNAYDAAAIEELIAVLGAHFPAPDGSRVREICLEVNPELVRPGDFERYRNADVTRVSIGVQSFEPSEIATLGRKHVPADVTRVVESARRAGIPSLSLDLMFGIPGQTLASWRRSLAAAVALDVDHVSTYGLTVEPGTPYAAWQARDPAAFLDSDREADLYAAAMEMLGAAGYEHYEISNFARPGHRCRHNENYWENGEYVGLGVGAASYRGGVRWVQTRSLQTYLDAAAAGERIPREEERLSPERACGEAIMLALRTEQGVRLGAFKERYGIDVLARYAPIVAEFEPAGLLAQGDGRLFLTTRGRFVANDVCGAFVTFE